MADPKKENATPKDIDESQAPGNGDAWGTVHNKAPEPASPFGEDAKDADSGDGNGAEPDEGKKAAEESAPETAPEEGEDVLDAVLEAEAAAIIEEAMDEVNAEAANAQAQKELQEWKDKYVRLHAEWDTYRRRQKEQAAQQKALAAEKLVSSLIPVIDDLERSIDYAQKNGEEGLLGGVEAVLAKFVDTLNKDGVEVIDPKGEAFDALEAQAVGTVDDPSQPDETVADVYQKGYKIGTKVLRPAMVTVTTGGPARPKPEEE